MITDRNDLPEGVKMISLHLTVTSDVSLFVFKDAGQEEEALVAAETWTTAFRDLHAFNPIHNFKP